MNKRYFIDTNILVYAFDNSIIEKHLKAKEIVASFFNRAYFFISTQVVNELIFVIQKKFTRVFPEKELIKFVNTFDAEKIAIIDKTTITTALRIQSDFKVSFWDSLIVSAAYQTGCNAILSENFSENSEIKGIKIINPLSSKKSF